MKHENIAKLKYILNLNKMSISDLAKHLEIGYQTLLYKLNGKSDFTLKEIKHIGAILNLNENDIQNIFLS